MSSINRIMYLESVVQEELKKKKKKKKELICVELGPIRESNFLENN